MGNLKKEVVINKLVSPPLPLYDSNFPILFFWSPKGGCTSLAKWYFYHIGLLETASQYESIHSYRMNEFQIQPHYEKNILKALVNDEKNVYKLVRDPFTRAVSSYFATITNESIMRVIAPHLKDGMSFKQFLYIIRNIGVTKGAINLHIAQQYTDGEELLIKNYIRLENFMNELKTIEKQYNLPHSPIETIVKSPHHITDKMKKFDERCFAEVKMSQSSLNKPVPDYQNFYNEETMQLVKEIYKHDFVTYQYSQTLKTV
ncbi:sulfotransferase family 2 domain-containing protein [Alkalihalobacillus sp. CinArs1]|uniref:sulfotransferase family 2 domain-containing protein n=1 Tax=Alkalihalobacillus sp. CinArs1 TaxID=2995314 RepID=UPI0022DE8D39|nr:sulfotransferase family 2 domain-containing protein [Alkalihalobacillus sp. CinArs1]